MNNTEKYLLSLFLVLSVFVGTYFIYQHSKNGNFTLTDNSTQNNSTQNNSGSNDKIEYYTQFTFKGESDRFSALANDLDRLLKGTAKDNADSDLYLKVYEEALRIYNDQSAPAQERSYAINILNLAYVQNFDSAPFVVAIKSDTDIYGVYNSYLNEVAKYKPLKNGAPASLMFDVGQPNTNYATQKTIAYLNGKAYDLYPNSYSFLRQNLNTVQANSILFNNYDLGKNYKDIFDYNKQIYSQDYVNTVEAKMNKFKTEGTLYKDLSYSSYEVDIMYSSGVLYSLEYMPLEHDNSPQAIAQKRKILDEMDQYADHMYAMANMFDKNKNLFFGQVIAALTKAQIAMTGLESDDQNSKLIAEGVQMINTLTQNTSSKQLAVWIRSLPRTGVLEKRLEFLMSKDDTLKAYVDGVRK